MASPTSFSAFLENAPAERRAALEKLRALFRKHLPKGFQEVVLNGMLSFVVPHRTYPDGYHCDPKSPLPFLSIASQKHFIAVYHMGLYANPKLLEWFEREWPRYVKTKLDMGKSCIRLKKIETIPYPLLEKLATKVTVDDWIACYEEKLKR